jgi:hypothetical protein
MIEQSLANLFPIKNDAVVDAHHACASRQARIGEAEVELRSPVC